MNPERDIHPLDNILQNPSKATKYLVSEHLIGLISSLFIFPPSLDLLYSNSSQCFACDSYLTYWLTGFVTLRCLDFPFRLINLQKLVSLYFNDAWDDGIFTTRKLMRLVRSLPFSLLKANNMFGYLVFILGFLRLKYGNPCPETDTNLYSVCIYVSCVYLTRIFLGVIRFHFEAKSAREYRNLDITQVLTNGATIDMIEKIELVKLGGKFKNLREECPICTEVFQKGDLVRLLPCNKTHYFHQHCLDRWLIRKDKCPLCAISVSKKLN